jgi:hydroxypyruvate isomerase
LAAGTPPGAVAATRSKPSGEPFSLNFAPEFHTFAHSAGADEIENVRFMHSVGFRALQDTGWVQRPAQQQAAIASELQRLGMTLGAFLMNPLTFKTPDLVMGVPEANELFLKEVRQAIEVAMRTNARWLIGVPGFEAPRVDRARQIANIVEVFKRAAGMLEPHGLIMVVEPVSWVDGGLLIRDLADAFLLCKAVASPACKILCDVFHQQIQRGNLLDSMEQCWEEIAYFHIGDVPGRNEPSSGEINYQNVFGYLRAKGYQGLLGMEHGVAVPGREGEAGLIAAYRELDRPDEARVAQIMAALPQRLTWR